MTLSLSSPISAFPLKRLFFPTSLKPSIPTPVFLSLSLAKHCLNMSSVPVSLPKYDFQTNWDVPQFSDDQMDAVADETLKRYSLSRDRKRNESGVAIVWFRNDLRVLDNEALFQAWKSSQAILPVYCLDPRLFGTTHYFGFPKTGVLRAQFLIDCLANLKKNLMKRGLNLLIQHGKPEDILPSIAKAFGAHTVYAHQETCSEEILVEKLLTNSLRRVVLPPVDIATSIPKTPKLQLIWGSTMYHLDDLPFGSSNVPDVYTQFRKSVESKCKIRGCIKIPPSLGPLPSGSLDEIGGWGCVPSLDQLGLNMEKHNGGMHFIGGENAALARVNEYFWNKDLLRVYKETRNAMLGPDYSTKFSPWLAFGCLSPRYAYEEVKRYEKERVANDSTYWVLFELIWRDYFRFLSIKYANSIFHLGGPRRVKGLNWNQDMALFESWRDGRTGLSVHFWSETWVWTGAWEPSGLKLALWIMTHVQIMEIGLMELAQTYDPEGEYVSYWLPELRVLPKEKRHFPGTSYIKQVVPLKFGNANPRNSNQFKGQSHRGGFERRKGQRS
ncbi:hypothetical protein AMTR_s00025p00168820 [Amborella trichopoda]|uniref:Cryptochrome DASH n=1 Tax=Amborella trichopoda TaxID=13333 RepID=W1PX25_AMBTC|nr:hypothetical protein AMTR_s00025p00168820 [Amborella trichopoda]